MSALFTVFLRLLPAIVVILVILFLAWITYIVFSHISRGAMDEVQKTTMDNADWLEIKLSHIDKLSNKELHDIAKYISKTEDDVDLD